VWNEDDVTADDDDGDDSWRGGDGNEVAAGRVKGINSNSICKAQLSDKVKSLFEADTHTHTHSEPVR